jgi:small subunit ribosomal protein S6e
MLPLLLDNGIQGGNFMKLVISDPKGGKSYQVEVPKESETRLIGTKIGQTLDGGLAGAAGYKIEVTGGSDKEGFPMRKDIPGVRRGRFLLSSGPGFKSKNKGERMRKTIRGNTISEETMQINAKVVEYGEKPLAELFPSAKKEKKE